MRGASVNGPGVAAGPYALTFGWDVGGAHLKVSATGPSGRIDDVGQWVCPLWQGLDHLHRAIDLALARWPAAARPDARHAVTMTGEMVDLFASREEGVRAIAEALAARLGPHVRFYGGDAGWLSAQHCADAWRQVASANWLATASWLATRLPDAVLVDIGSTTTDIVPISNGRVVAEARDDAGRLATGELVYQGVVRTPLCGLAQRVAFGGTFVNVMNEWFATTADVYRLTGEIDAAHDVHASADGGPKTEAASRVRLARMIGRDAREARDADWLRFALRWRTLQLAQTGINLERVEGHHDGLASAPLVGAGCGRFLVAALARERGRPYVDIGALTGASGQCGDWAATCAPSVALALLAARASPFDASAPGVAARRT